MAMSISYSGLCNNEREPITEVIELYTPEP